MGRRVGAYARTRRRRFWRSVVHGRLLRLVGVGSVWGSDGGLVFLGRQFKQERRALAPKYADSNEGKTPIAQQDSPAA